MTVDTQYKRIEGWLFDEEAQQLQLLSQGALVLEIGCFLGKSTIAMLPGAKHVTVVDNFLKAENQLRRFLNNTKRYKTKLLTYAIDSKAWYTKNKPNGFNFIFHDGDHSYDEVKLFLSWLEQHNYTGTFSIHDYGKSEEFPGLTTAIDESEFVRRRRTQVVGSLLTVTVM